MRPPPTSELTESVVAHSVERLVSARIVALSGGKDSTAMALRLAEVEPEAYEYCITPTGRELPEMIEHWKRLECLLGKPLTRIPGPTLLERIIAYKTLPNFRLRYCTREVKIEPFIKYAASVSPAELLRGHTCR